MRAARRLASLAARASARARRARHRGVRAGAREAVAGLDRAFASSSSSSTTTTTKTATGDESAPAVDAPRGVLLRDFIRESLYGRERGYFARATPPVGEMRAPIAFRALAGADDYHRALAGRYAALSSQWLTPVEVFKPHYANAIADYVLRRHAPRRDRPLKVYGAFCFASSSSRASVVRSKSSPEPPRARRARSRVFRLKPPRVVDSDPNASRRPPGRVMSEQSSAAASARAQRACWTAYENAPRTSTNGRRTSPWRYPKRSPRRRRVLRHTGSHTTPSAW